MKYVVSWDIEIETDDPVDAAKEALAMQRDPDSTATVFYVDEVEGKGYRYQVDLTHDTIHLSTCDGLVELIKGDTICHG